MYIWCICGVYTCIAAVRRCKYGSKEIVKRVCHMMTGGLQATFSLMPQQQSSVQTGQPLWEV